MTHAEYQCILTLQAFACLSYARVDGYFLCNQHCNAKSIVKYLKLTTCELAA